MRRLIGAVVTGAFLLAAVGYCLFAPDRAEPPAEATSTSPTEPQQETSDRASDLAEPGILMVVTPSLNGDLLVTETVRLPGPTDSVTLGPPRLARAGSQFDDVEATVTDVRLRSPGQASSFPGGEVDAPTRVSVPSTETAEVSYRLAGATVPSVPSRPGRSTGGVSPLLRELDSDLPVHVVVTGPAVLNLACPQLPASEQACRNGTPLAAQTKDPLPFSDAVVTVQLDLRRT